MTRARRLTAFATALTVLSLLVSPGVAVADDVRDRQWHLGFLHVGEAHRYSQGEGITVAVIDTGVDASHPDLVGNVLPGTETFEGNAGGDGHTDINGHGTGMAGLIAAHGHGPGATFGALGIAPKANILPVRDVDAANGVRPAGSNAQLSRGIDYAVAHGARVLCLATGGGTSDDLEQSVRAALAADVVVVAGVGNRPAQPMVGWPAAYPGVVAAAGVDQAGVHADISLTGSEAVLAAPAVAIESTDHGGGYSFTRGTSDATAIIAGAAALVRARYPSLSATEVVHRLTATAIDKGPPGRDEEYGYGVVDVVGALVKDVPSQQPTIDAGTPDPPSAKPVSSETSGVVLVSLVVLVLIVVVVGSWVGRRRRNVRRVLLSGGGVDG